MDRKYYKTMSQARCILQKYCKNAEAGCDEEACRKLFRHFVQMKKWLLALCSAHQLSHIYRKQGRLSDCIIILRKSIHVFTLLKNWSCYVNAVTDLYAIYYVVHDYAKAKEVLQSTTPYLHKLKAADQAILFYNRGILHFAQSRYNNALQSHGSALRILENKRVVDPLLDSLCHIAYADTMLKSSGCDAQQESFRESKAILSLCPAICRTAEQHYGYALKTTVIAYKQQQMTVITWQETAIYLTDQLLRLYYCSSQYQKYKKLMSEILKSCAWLLTEQYKDYVQSWQSNLAYIKSDKSKHI